MHPVLRRRLNATVWVAPYLSRDGFGDPTFGPAVPLPARIEPTTKRVTSPQGEELVAEILVLVESGVGPEDRVWLPGRDRDKPDQARRPKSVFEVPGEFAGSTHLEVYL